MKKLVLVMNKDTYEIRPFKESNWQSVTRNNERIALVMDEPSAMQVIYNDIRQFGTCKFLTREDFREVTIEA